MATGDVDKVIADVLKETKPARDEHSERIKGFDKQYEVYRPKQQARTRSGSMLRIPYAQSNMDTVLVNIVQDKPRCLVLPRTPDHTENARKFQLIMDYFSEHDHLVEKMAPLAQNALIYGIGVGKTHWKYETAERMKKRFVADEVTGARHPVTERENLVIYDGPSFEVWNVYDAWWDPNGRDVDSCAYFCLRSFVTRDYLLQNACASKGKHQPEDCDGIYHNVPELLEMGFKDKPAQSAQERRLNRSMEARHGRFELVEVWRDDRLTVYGNEHVNLRDGPNPHWHGRKPIVAASTRPDMLEMQGVPETELVDHIQQALWTNHNLRVENMLATVQRMWTYRESSVIDPKKIKIGPRALIGVVDHDDLKPMDVQPLPPEAYREDEALLARLQLISGVSPFVSGADMGSVDQNTATGISVLSEVAGRLLKFKASQLHWKCWQRAFEQWGNDIQQYLDRDIAIRIINEKTGEPGWSTAGPQEVVGDFDFVLAGGGESSSKQQRRSEMLQLLQAMGPLIQSGAVNIQALLTRVAETFDFINPGELIQAMPQMPPAAPTNGQTGQAPPGGPTGMPDQGTIEQMLAGSGTLPGQTGG